MAWMESAHAQHSLALNAAKAERQNNSPLSEPDRLQNWSICAGRTDLFKLAACLCKARKRSDLRKASLAGMKARIWVDLSETVICIYTVD